MACEKIFADLKQRNLTTVALISGTDAFGKSMRDQCVAVAPKAGITIAHEESYGPRDSDMTPQLTNIKGKAGVQAVINPGFGQGPAIVTRNYRQLGITLPLYQSHGVASKQFIDLAGPAADGVRLRPRCWWPTSCRTAIRRNRSSPDTPRPISRRPASRSPASAATPMTG
jgi:branched-chain amino acid transport system substrate-binding protein